MLPSTPGDDTHCRLFAAHLHACSAPRRYGLNYDGHCRKCPPFPAPPGVQEPANSGIRLNAPFDAQVGCKGCGAVSTANSAYEDGSDGHKVPALSPSTGDKCGRCALGYYGYLSSPPTTSPTVAIGCDTACPEESTTTPDITFPFPLGTNAPNQTAKAGVCSYCQAGYYVSDLSAIDPQGDKAATCTLCPGNSTTAFATTLVSFTTNSTAASEVCIYCKTGCGDLFVDVTRACCPALLTCVFSHVLLLRSVPYADTSFPRWLSTTNPTLLPARSLAA